MTPVRIFLLILAYSFGTVFCSEPSPVASSDDPEYTIHNFTNDYPCLVAKHTHLRIGGIIAENLRIAVNSYRPTRYINPIMDQCMPSYYHRLNFFQIHYMKPYLVDLMRIKETTFGLRYFGHFDLCRRDINNLVSISHVWKDGLVIFDHCDLSEVYYLEDVNQKRIRDAFESILSTTELFVMNTLRWETKCFLDELHEYEAIYQVKLLELGWNWDVDSAFNVIKGKESNPWSRTKFQLFVGESKANETESLIKRLREEFLEGTDIMHYVLALRGNISLTTFRLESNGSVLELKPSAMKHGNDVSFILESFCPVFYLCNII
ncbi:hypothetical protein Ddc_10743 [Ditylenchus destructor]|nr:hypothetical protein Ddc_10743 [Ditylenchus destructor]